MGDSERTVYLQTILQTKSPLELIEILKLRLNESRAINSNLIEFFEGYLKTQESYASKLNQVLLKGSKLFNNDAKFNKDLDTLGLFEPVWNSLIGEINTELKLVDSKTKTLNIDVLVKLQHFEKKYKGNSENLNNLRKLAYKYQLLGQDLNRSSAKQQEYEQLSREWETRVPTFVEIVENYDFNRFILLKDVFLSLQSSNQDTLPELSKLSEKSLEFVLNFDPNEEIKRFAQEVSQKDLQFDSQDLLVTVNEKPEKPAEKHHSFLGNSSKHRQASNASMNTFNSSATENGLMNDGFTGLPAKKERNKLRSRVGSIFGKKKKDKKSKNSFNAIAESPMDSTNTSRSSLPLSSEPTSTPPVSAPVQQQIAPPPPPQQQQISPPPQQVNRKSSVVSNDLYQTSRSGPIQPQLTLSSQPLTPLANKNGSLDTTGEYYSAPSQTSPTSEHHIPPPVPVARGATMNVSGRIPHSTSEVDSLSQQMKKSNIHHHGELPPPPQSRQRRDIQSGLFVGLDPSNTANSTSPPPPIYQGSETPMSRQVTGLQRQSTGVLPLASFTHPDLVFPGLNASVAEVVNATFKDNKLIKGSIVSEVAFSYIVGSNDAKIPSSIKLLFPLAPQLGKLIVNNQFLRQINPSEFDIVDVQLIHLKTVGAVKYSLPILSSVVSVVPVWRFENHQASVVISVKLSDEVLQHLPQDVSIVLTNFIVSVSIAGAVATSAATRPTGSFNKDKARITWVYNGPVTLGHDKEERIIARFATEGLAREGEHGVQVKFTVNNQDGAPLVTTPIELHSQNIYGIDPFGTDNDNGEQFVDDWKLVPTVKTLIAGRYEGHS